MQLASSPSWAYGRREFRAAEVASSRAAAVSGRMDPAKLKRSRKRLRRDFGQLVGVRP
ncbi:MAG: hypothetical protein IPJ27_23460 [Candidatus Accumulibacter sp.]|uniref:Uncharacterized protein n=1 Tax=Candidatus Accumulibacter proximus TaxID=2954385 RepID=A0A935UJ95_9PROT|nr:hypothetical protein [Candidatus Accumulibacter proximus]